MEDLFSILSIRGLLYLLRGRAAAGDPFQDVIDYDEPHQQHQHNQTNLHHSFFDPQAQR